MVKKIYLFLVLLFLITYSFSQDNMVKLPLPKKEGRISVEAALSLRRSIREYLPLPLKVEEVSQLLWAAYGKSNYKLTSPSAGALYPLKIYVLIGNVDNIPVGFYRYDNQYHSLIELSTEDFREKLCYAALSQESIKNAPFVILICADYNITMSTYGERGRRYVDIEVGHVGQNIYLETTALNLGTVAIGAFNDKEVKEILRIKEEPIYIMPVGRPKEK